MATGLGACCACWATLAAQRMLQVVQAVARGKLLGDGDVLRALGTAGCRLHHTQDPRLELDFGVASLATDLRSGVRLCRLVELLAGALHALWSILCRNVGSTRV